MPKVSQEFVKIMAPLIELFEKTMTTPMWGIYFEALQDLGRESIALAVARAIRECRFFPKPAELRELAGDGLSLNDRAELALSVVRRAAREIPDQHSITFPPPINAAIEAMGGREKVFSWEYSDKGWTYERRAEFLALYKGKFSEEGERGPDRLPGDAERWARKNGRQLPPVMPVGFKTPGLAHATLAISDRGANVLMQCKEGPSRPSLHEGGRG